MPPAVRACLDRHSHSVAATECGLVRSYLVCYYWPTRRTCVCCNNNAAIVYAANNGCAGGCGFWKRYALSVKGEVSVVVGEVEAGHCDVVVAYEWC